MKPLRLSAQAFGPYLERVEIDFTKFYETGLFLITGPTGGGKTSLLDAASFALYCKATGGRRDFAGMRCMSAPPELPTEVEFDFTLQGRAYRFRRSRFYKTNRRTKELQAQESHQCFTLENGEAHLLESGAESAIRRRAESLLHLTCEQFSQVAVLPQGEFLRLLRAGSQEKGEILRTLFSAGIWKDLRDRLQERSKALEEETRRLSDMALTLLRQAQADTPERLAQMVEEQGRRVQALGQEAGEAEKRLAGSEKLLRAREELALLEDAKAQALRQRGGARERLSRWEKAAPLIQERRGQAEALRRQAVAVAQKETQLREQISQAQQAENARAEAQAAARAQAEQEAQAARLGKQAAETARRMEAGRRFEVQYRQAADILPSLVAKRASLEKRLASLEEWEKRRVALEKARQALALAEKEAGETEAAAHALSRQLEGQDTLRRRNAALELAQALGESAPCPVCGSRHHPAPACGAGSALDAKALENLRDAEKKARAAAQATAARMQAGRQALGQAQEAFEEQRSACGPQPPSLEEAAQALAAAKAEEAKAQQDAKLLPAARQKLEKLQKEREHLAKEEAAARERSSALGAKAAELERRAKETGDIPSLPELSRQAEENRLAYGELEKQGAALLQEAQGTAAELERAGEAFALAEGALKKAEQDLAGFAAPWQQPPELPALRQQVQALHQARLELSQQLGEASSQLRGQKAALEQVIGMQGKLEALSAAYSRVARLARSAAGNNPLKMPILQYVLSITLDQVLVSANRFFAILSRGRYALRLMESPKSGKAYGGLDLEVLDGASMLPRSIETLSGGEQFLASLALAFGLSDVVQAHAGAVGLEAIFIDEGFGSLDSDTLDTAMRALATLQAGGRLIGVISHVSELQGRIPSRIQVSRDALGFSHAHVRL